MKKLIKFAKNSAKSVSLTALALGSTIASASPDLTTEIAAAETTTISNVGLAVGAVLAVGIVSFGVNAVLRWVGK